MRKPIVVVTSARVVAQVLDLGGRTVAASLMRELCDLVEALNARAREFHELLEVAATICEGSEEPPSQYEIEVHHRNGGRWLLAADGVTVLLDDCDVSVEARRTRSSRWWALDKAGRPCRRPRSAR